MLIAIQKSQRKGDEEKVKVEGESDKEKEVIIRREIVPRTRGRSTWNWHEEFAVEWNKNFTTKNEKRNPT